MIHLDDRSPTSLSLSWTLSRRPPARINQRYELMYRRKVGRSSGAPFFPRGTRRLYEIQTCAEAVTRVTRPRLLTVRPQDGDGERDVTTYTVLIVDKSSVQIHDLTPGTTYVFRVQALGPEGNAGSYSLEHEFHTSLGSGLFRSLTSLRIHVYVTC